MFFEIIVGFGIVKFHDCYFQFIEYMVLLLTSTTPTVGQPKMALQFMSWAHTDCFTQIMVISFAQILQESAEKLMPSGSHSTAQLPNVAIFAMVSTIVVKGIIWFGCIKIKTTQVQALAQGILLAPQVPKSSN
jgi:hypothetical protein